MSILHALVLLVSFVGVVFCVSPSFLSFSFPCSPYVSVIFFVLCTFLLFFMVLFFLIIFSLLLLLFYFPVCFRLFYIFFFFFVFTLRSLFFVVLGLVFFLYFLVILRLFIPSSNLPLVSVLPWFFSFSFLRSFSLNGSPRGVTVFLYFCFSFFLVLILRASEGYSPLDIFLF